MICEQIPDGYRTASQNELKRIQIGILTAVSEFCESHGIRYYLFYGSLIGAVRHKGFIPWDDDIDIVMLRDDYEKFLHSFNAADPRYRAYSPSISDGYPYFHAKVCSTDSLSMETIENKPYQTGVSIDLFPMDYVPSGWTRKIVLEARVKRFNIMMLSKTVLSRRNRKWYKKAILTILGVLFSRYSAASLCKYIDKTLGKSRPSEYVWCPASVYGSRDTHIVSDFGDGVIGNFEEAHFTLPRNFDVILKRIYGEYMGLPPKEKRVSQHDSVMFVKEHINTSEG